MEAETWKSTDILGRDTLKLKWNQESLGIFWLPSGSDLRAQQVVQLRSRGFELRFSFPLMQRLNKHKKTPAN